MRKLICVLAIVALAGASGCSALSMSAGAKFSFEILKLNWNDESSEQAATQVVEIHANQSGSQANSSENENTAEALSD